MSNDIIVKKEKPKEPEDNSLSLTPISLSKEEKRDIKKLQQEVAFWSGVAQNHLNNLSKTTAELDQADLTIQSLREKIKREQPEELTRLLAEKDKQIDLISRENESNKEKVRVLEAKIEGLISTSTGLKKDNNWHSKREAFTQILTDNNLSNDRIRKELGNINQGWENDVVGELLTEETKKKIEAYNQLVVEKNELKKKKEKLFIFVCNICDQEKTSKLHRFRINGLGFDPHKYQKICDFCIKRVDWIKEKKEDFF